MTGWGEIERAAMLLIQNDPVLDFDLARRPAMFYRRMAGMMTLAIPRFCLPPEAVRQLQRFTPPAFQQTRQTLQEAHTAPFDVEGAAGYELVSAGLQTTDSPGEPYWTPLAVAGYDPVTGLVTLGENVEAGSTLVLDFYRDGSFAADLDGQARGILAYCLYLVWEHRLDNDTLERRMKLRDSGFSTYSEANHTNAGTSRLRSADERLNDLMHSYAQHLEYLRVVEGWEEVP